MSVKKINYTLIGTTNVLLDEEDSLEDIQALICDREDKKLELSLIKGINWELTEIFESEDEDDCDASDDEDYEELDFE